MKIKKLVFPLLLALPLALGTIGYLTAGEPLIHSLYAAFALYFVNPVSEAYNLLIGIARWLAPLMTASGVLLLMKNALRELWNRLISKRKGAFAVCGDSPLRGALCDSIGRKAILSEKNRLYDAENVVLLFEKEDDGFAFYRENEKRLRGRRVYIRSDCMDMYYTDGDGFRLFNLNELAVKDFWLRNSLGPLLRERRTLSVVLIGGGPAGGKLLETAVLNNIYTADQKIVYHVFGNSYFVRALHGDLQMMNGDELVCHGEPWTARQEVLDAADRIVFAEPPRPDLLLALADRCFRTEIFCRGLNEDLLRLAVRGNLRSFGAAEQLLTAENVTAEKLYAAAKRLNFTYACMYGGADPNDPNAAQTEWQKLDPFTKHSNIAATEYHRVRMQMNPALTAAGLDDGLAELEHVRWARFHSWYHWRYGAGADGKKDAANRLHPCLQPFSALTREVRDKDLDAIRVLLETLPNG